MKKSCLNKRYGKLVVIEAMWPKLKCRCDCGNEKIVWASLLYNGDTKSCGCLLKTQGGLTTKHHSEYNVWFTMKDRCFNKKNPSYHNYGGRGVVVCDRWKNSFAFFLKDLKDIGVRPSRKHSIDRIDNNKNYEPGNCKWSTHSEQNNNTRRNYLIEYKNETKTLCQWAKHFNISQKTLWHRINTLSWPINEALTKPVKKKS